MIVQVNVKDHAEDDPDLFQDALSVSVGEATLFVDYDGPEFPGQTTYMLNILKGFLIATQEGYELEVKVK